jgi:hypothetical protein
MTMFYFNLRDGGPGVVDTMGTELRDVSEAKVHATQVARELMRRTELKKRPWQLDVYDEHGDQLFVLPFAAVDPTLDHLEPKLRQLIEGLCESRRMLGETLFDSEKLLWQLRAIRARGLGRPYLAAESGQRV